MKEIHEKYNGLNSLKPQIKDNEKLKQEVLTNVSDIYNKIYYIYKNKYNEKINSLDTKNRKELDYKKLRLSDNYLYSSEEEQEEQEEQKKLDEKTTDLNKLNEWIIEEEIDLNEELFKKIF